MSNLLRIVTNSERTSSACWKRHDYRYNQGLVPIGESPAPLRQGSLVHRMLSTWYRSGMALSIVDLRREIVAPWVDQRVASILEHAGTSEYLPPPEDDIQETHEIAAEASGMIGHYLAHWGAWDNSEWEILGVDLQLARALVHPEHGGPITDRPVGSARQAVMPGVATSKNAGRGYRFWFYGGELDMLVRERSTGLVWIVEHKTTADSDLVGYCRKLHLDPQIRGYAWALRKPDPKLSQVGPTEVAGVLYNVLRKAVPRSPPLLAAPKPTKKNPSPVSPGLSRNKSIVTTPAVYMAAVLAHGFNPDDYRDLLDDLAHKQFFGRDRYVLSDRDLDDWAVDAAWWALQVIADQGRPVHPRQVAVCQGVVPMHCPYTSICLEDNPGAREAFHLRTVRHEELAGPLADPWPIDDARRAAQAALPALPAWRVGRPPPTLNMPPAAGFVPPGELKSAHFDAAGIQPSESSGASDWAAEDPFDAS